MLVSSLSAHSLFDYVSFEGPDAIEFLQGQVTCDVQKLSAERSVVGALCNLKGRVVADFRLVLLSNNSILLQTSAGNGEKILNTLQRYAVFSKVDLAKVPGPAAVFGVIGEQADAALQEVFDNLPIEPHSVITTNDFSVIRPAGNRARFEVWCHSKDAVTALTRLDVMEEVGSIEDWTRADIEAGIAHVNANQSEEFTPQLLNYDISGIVDFEKGCYTGQEVVARMYYRGKAKKRLYRVHSGDDLSTELAQTKLREADQAIEVVSAAPPSDSPSIALAIVNTEYAKQSLEGDNAAQLQIEELVYSEN